MIKNYVIFEILNENERFICKKCKFILNNPHICLICGGIFCTECVLLPNLCPDCEVYEVVINLQLFNIIQETDFKCKICFEIIKMKIIEKHPKNENYHKVKCKGNDFGCLFIEMKINIE